MENKTSGNRFGRFWWLWILCVILSTQIGLALQFGNGIIRFGSNFLISISLLMIGVFFYSISVKEDNKNNISIKPFRNILLPWPKSAIFLATFVLSELLVITPLFAYTFYPCSGLDVIRKVNGCADHIPHRSLVNNIAFSKDGKMFATSEFQGDVKVWSYSDLALLNNLGDGWPSGAELSFSPDGEMLAVCGYKGATSIFEVRTGKNISTLLPHNDEGCDIVFAPDNNSVFVISDSEFQKWDVETGHLSQSIMQDRLDFLEITDDGKYLATGSRDGVIHIRNVSDGTLFSTIQQPYMRSLAFSHDGKYLITVGWDIESIKDKSKSDISIVNVWNIATAIIERTISLPGLRLDHISTSNSSDTFVVGQDLCSRKNRSPFEDSCSYLWQSIDTEIPTELKVPVGVRSLLFSPADHKLLIGSYGNLYIWNVP